MRFSTILILQQLSGDIKSTKFRYDVAVETFSVRSNIRLLFFAHSFYILIKTGLIGKIKRDFVKL